LIIFSIKLKKEKGCLQYFSTLTKPLTILVDELLWKRWH